MNRATWLNRELYDFNTVKIEIDGYNMNTVDEGSEKLPPLLLVHGTPGWSFEFRKIMKTLSQKYRVIAPDHLGFGLSDKPRASEVDYTPVGHARRLSLFIEKLQLKNLHLFVHDFGSSIGIGAIRQQLHNVQSITVSNSWLWSLNDYKEIKKPAALIQTKIGKFLYYRLNFSVNVLLRSSFADKKNLNAEIMCHYRKPMA